MQLGRPSGDRQTNISSFSTIEKYYSVLHNASHILNFFPPLQTVIVPRPPQMKATLTATTQVKKARNQTRRKKRKVYPENEESLHLMKPKFEYHLNMGMWNLACCLIKSWNMRSRRWSSHADSSRHRKNKSADYPLEYHETARTFLQNVLDLSLNK